MPHSSEEIRGSDYQQPTPRGNGREHILGLVEPWRYASRGVDNRCCAVPVGSGVIGGDTGSEAVRTTIGSGVITVLYLGGTREGRAREGLREKRMGGVRDGRGVCVLYHCLLLSTAAGRSAQKNQWWVRGW